MSQSTLNQSTSEQMKAQQSERTNPAIAQFNKLQELVFNRESALTFTQSLRLIATIVKEFATLLWLTLCYGLVALSWLGNWAVQSGQRTRTWWIELKHQQAQQSPAAMAAETGKSVLSQSQAAIFYVVRQAKKQVGILDEK
jgi:hypothetical protein